MSTLNKSTNKPKNSHPIETPLSKKAASIKQQQMEVDEASKESFPASDPPSWTTGKEKDED